MWNYAAFGLIIRSAIVLPELLAAEPGPADVAIRRARISRPRPTGASFAVCAGHEAFLGWDDVGAFLVRGGHSIEFDPLPSADEPLVRLFLLGAALGVLLHQRGLLVLHASAVAVGGGAVAFVGESGYGKSTTAAALHARGHDLITDDLLALDGGGMALPAFPRLKLSQDAFALDSQLHSAPLHPEDIRLDCRLTSGYARHPARLSRIYVLAEGSRVLAEPLSPRDAFVELLGNSYAPRVLGAGASSPKHFQQCAQLAATVPVLRLARPLKLGALPELVKLIENQERAAEAVAR